MISYHWVLWSRMSGTSVCRFKSVPTWWLRGPIKILQPKYSCCYQRVCFRCLAVKSIWDWMKPYLVVKISSYIVTEHCCQVCVLSMIFCRAVAVCWHGKWLRNQQETSRSTHVDLKCGRAHIMMINQHESVLHAFSVPNWLEMCGVADVLTVLLLSPTR